MVRIPVESEENRVVRPPRQTCHKKGSGANRCNRNDRHNRQEAGTRQKNRASAKGASVGGVYRKVSFNAIDQRQLEFPSNDN
jgi:hypothetical protein